MDPCQDRSNFSLLPKISQGFYTQQDRNSPKIFGFKRSTL